MIRTLTGANGFLMRQELRSLTAEFIKQYGEFGYERVSAEDHDYNALLDRVQTLPFLAEKRLVVIDNPASNKQLAEKITDFLASVNDQTDVVFVEVKFDKRSVIYKTLKKQTDLHEYAEPDEPGLVRWLSQEAQAQGGRLSTNDARLLVQRVGINQLRLSNELKKLLSYDATVSRQSIELLTTQTPQSTTFELLDAAFAGRTSRALALYDEQRRQKVEPHAILALIGWQLHVLAVVKSGQSLPPAEVASKAKLNPFVVRKTAGLARQVSQPALTALINKTLRLDIRLKSEAMDADAAVQELLLSISNVNLHY